MKANELMIGDWVQDITPCVIDAISNEDICTYRDENGYITANPSNLKPIPLTAEILEKNGFAYGKKGREYTLSDDYYDIIVAEWSDSIWVIRYECTEMVAPHHQTTFSYIHEFQHFLKECGLSEMAENIKVE